MQLPRGQGTDSDVSTEHETAVQHGSTPRESTRLGIYFFFAG